MRRDIFTRCDVALHTFCINYVVGFVDVSQTTPTAFRAMPSPRMSLLCSAPVPGEKRAPELTKFAALNDEISY